MWELAPTLGTPLAGLVALDPEGEVLLRILRAVSEPPYG
jgi:hypothetical protein